MEHWSAAQYREYSAKKHKVSGRGKTVSHAEVRFEQLYILPRLHKKQIKNYSAQVEFELWPQTETERRIVFTPDFVIEWADGRKEVIELKGKQVKKMQRDYHLRVRRFKELYPEYQYREEKSEGWA